MIVLTDVDNCISDDGNRLGLIDWHKSHPTHRFHRYHLAAGADRPANAAYIPELNHGVRVIALTAMPQAYARIRRQWLARHFPAISAVMFRPNDNHEPSARLKCRMVAALRDQFGVNLRDVVVAYDDRQDVVDALRAEFGLPARVLCINDQPWADWDTKVRGISR